MPETMAAEQEFRRRSRKTSFDNNFQHMNFKIDALFIVWKNLSPSKSHTNILEVCLSLAKLNAAPGTDITPKVRLIIIYYGFRLLQPR